MPLKSRASNLSAAFLRCAGVLLVVLGVVHSIATPHIADLLNGSPTDVYQRAVGPTLLNHVLVGILLLPLGFTTWLASSAGNRSQRWARQVLILNAIIVLTFPVSIALFMRRAEYYHVPLFLAGVALTAAISLLMVVAVSVLIRNEPV
jgi:hypothetical protein